jgi:hypothetical protein
VGTKEKTRARKIAKNIKQEERMYYIFGVDDTYEAMEDRGPSKIRRIISAFSSFLALKVMPYVNLFSFL